MLEPLSLTSDDVKEGAYDRVSADGMAGSPVSRTD